MLPSTGETCTSAMSPPNGPSPCHAAGTSDDTGGLPAGSWCSRAATARWPISSTREAGPPGVAAPGQLDWACAAEEPVTSAHSAGIVNERRRRDELIGNLLVVCGARRPDGARASFAVTVERCRSVPSGEQLHLHRVADA